ncbi:MAG: hypothetical protein IJW50_08180 [Clostridia bacterium]|nr:hypothetical protein [Clostridia bacterium]
MKIKNSSRITALILTLVMILPLISLPTFAEEVVSNVIWSEDFENVAVGDYPGKGDGDSLQAQVKQDGTNKYWEIPFFAYDKDGNVIKGDASYCTCGKTSDNGTPEDTSDDVYTPNLGTATNCNCQNINDNFIINNKAVSCSDYDVVVFAADYYIEEDAFGHITSQFRKSVSATVTATKDGVTTETASTGLGWVGLFQLDCRTDDVATFTAEGLNTVYYNRTVNKGEWFTLSMVLNLDTGSMALYADEVLVFTTTLNKGGALSNISVSADTWIVFKPTNQKGADLIKYDGAVHVDNVAMYNGDSHLDVNVWNDDFERLTVGNTVAKADMGNNGANTAVPTTVTVAQEASKVLKFMTSVQGKTDEYVVASARNSKGGASSSGGTKKTVTDVVLGDDNKPTKVTVDGTEYTVGTVAACPNADKRTTGITIDSTVYYLFTAYEFEYYYGGDVVDKMILAKNPAISYANYDTVVFEAKYYISTDFKADLELQFYKYSSANTASGSYKAFYKLYGKNTTAYLSVDNGSSPAAPLNRGAWNTISVVINLDTGAYDIYVNALKANSASLSLGDTNWSITANCWSLAKVLKGTCTANSGYIMLDDLCIYEGTEPRGDIYSNDFEKYAAGSTVVKDGYINYAYADANATTAGTVYEKAATIDTTQGSNALKLTYQSIKDAEGANRIGYNVDKNFKLATPQISYKNMDSVVFDFDVFVPNTSSGAIHVRYGSASTSGDYFYKQGAENVIIKDGNAPKAVNNESVSWTPDLFRLTYTTAGEDAIFGGQHNGLTPTAKVKVNEWATLSVVVNLKDGTLAGYVEGVLVYSGNIMFQKSMQDRTENGNLGYSATNPDATAKTITVYEYTVDGNKVYKDANGKEIDAKWVQYTAKVSKKDVVVLKNVEGDTVTWKKTDGTVVTPDSGTTPTMKVANVWYWVKNPTNVTLNANQLCITGLSAIKSQTNVGGDLLVDNVAIYEGNAPKNAIYKAEDFAGIVNTEEEVQIRLAENSGLRFATEINTELLATLQAVQGVKEVKIGTLIAPERYLTDGTELTVESLTRAAQKMLKVEADVDNYYQGYDNDETTTHFVGSIVDILASNIGQDFCARGYVEVVMESGQSVYIYSADYATRNVQEAATAIIAEVGEENLDEVYGVYAQVLRNYAAGLQANPEE